MVKRSPPSLPEPGVWTGMASANVWEALRWKRANTHRGSRRRNFEPHREAGYTSAVVIRDSDLEPDVWTGTAEADVLGPLRQKRAETHRGSRRRCIGPHQEAGYTSAIVIADPYANELFQSAGVHIHPHMYVIYGSHCPASQICRAAAGMDRSHLGSLTGCSGIWSPRLSFDLN